jgi:hypothetical protein
MTASKLIVNYYLVQDIAYLSLVMFSPNSSYIRDLLLRMALSGNTTSGTALLHSLLAVSSLKRSGSTPEVMQFKVSALQSLTVSAKGVCPDPNEAAQHVAACMLLCALEVRCVVIFLFTTALESIY